MAVKTGIFDITASSHKRICFLYRPELFCICPVFVCHSDIFNLQKIIQLIGNAQIMVTGFFIFDWNHSAKRIGVCLFSGGKAVFGRHLFVTVRNIFFDMRMGIWKHFVSFCHKPAGRCRRGSKIVFRPDKCKDRCRRLSRNQYRQHKAGITSALVQTGRVKVIIFAVHRCCFQIFQCCSFHINISKTIFHQDSLIKIDILKCDITFDIDRISII